MSIILVFGNVILPNFVEALEFSAIDSSVSILIANGRFQVENSKYLIGRFDVDAFEYTFAVLVFEEIMEELFGDGLIGNHRYVLHSGIGSIITV